MADKTLAEKILENGAKKLSPTFKEVNGKYITIPAECVVTLSQAVILWEKYGDDWYIVAEEYKRYVRRRQT